MLDINDFCFSINRIQGCFNYKGTHYKRFFVFASQKRSAERYKRFFLFLLKTAHWMAYKQFFVFGRFSHSLLHVLRNQFFNCQFTQTTERNEDMPRRPKSEIVVTKELKDRIFNYMRQNNVTKE